MGMGEPLQNYDAVLDAVRLMTDVKVFGLSPQHVTVSTVGVHKNITRLKDDAPKVNLAVSLHAANQELRAEIVPSARAHKLPKLMAAMKDWQEATAKKILIEYCVLQGVNDRARDAVELGELLEPMDVIVNLIPWNPTDAGAGLGFRAPAKEAVKEFQRTLREGFGVFCTVRAEFGQEINGACGQLVLADRGVARPSPGGVGDIEDLGASGAARPGYPAPRSPERVEAGAEARGPTSGLARAVGAAVSGVLSRVRGGCG